MADGVEFLRAIEMSFPVEPLPNQFFWARGEASLGYDIPQELENRISGRRWTDISLMDWRMIGTSPAVSRGYLEPATFMYYVPSIIVGAFQELEFIEFALEAIIPYNHDHVPRGPWWSEFSASASSLQRAALSAFLAHVRLSLWDDIGPANRHLLGHAEKVWAG